MPAHKKGDAEGKVLADTLRVELRALEVQSHDKICRSSLGVKAWKDKLPSVSLVRPSQCRRCGAAARPAGGNLVVHGDGTRERQVRGPATPDGAPTMTSVLGRRYQCQRCGACMLVVPQEILPRRLYTGGGRFRLWRLGHSPPVGGRHGVRTALRDDARLACGLHAAPACRARRSRARGAGAGGAPRRRRRLRGRRSSSFSVISISGGGDSRRS